MHTRNPLLPPPASTDLSKRSAGKTNLKKSCLHATSLKENPSVTIHLGRSVLRRLEADGVLSTKCGTRNRGRCRVVAAMTRRPPETWYFSMLLTSPELRMAEHTEVHRRGTVERKGVPQSILFYALCRHWESTQRTAARSVKPRTQWELCNCPGSGCATK